MEKIILKATTRTENPKKTRDAGFIPGVLNEHDTTSTIVKFEDGALNKIISNHGSNAKLWVDLGTEQKFGFIKEVQKNPRDRKITHIAIQLVSKDQEVKLHLPINFHGREELLNKLLKLHIHKMDVEVFGKTELMPDSALVDVTKKKAGDNVTAADFHLPTGIKILDNENEIYAAIKAAKDIVAPEPAEAAAAPAPVAEKASK